MNMSDLTLKFLCWNKFMCRRVKNMSDWWAYYGTFMVWTLAWQYSEHSLSVLFNNPLNFQENFYTFFIFLTFLTRTKTLFTLGQSQSCFFWKWQSWSRFWLFLFNRVFWERGKSRPLHLRQRQPTVVDYIKGPRCAVGATVLTKLLTNAGKRICKWVLFYHGLKVTLSIYIKVGFRVWVCDPSQKNELTQSPVWLFLSLP